MSLRRHPTPQTVLIVPLNGSIARDRTSPFVCDANFWFPQGQPSLVFGVGDPSWGIHGTDEHLPVADLLKATKVFAAVTMAWCGVADA